MAYTETAPTTDQVRIGRPGDPCIMVIFGAAGDLTRRKLIPALYNLAKLQLLPQEFAIVGVAHTAMSTEEFGAKIAEDLKKFVEGPVDPKLSDWFLQRIHYIAAEFDDQSV